MGTLPGELRHCTADTEVTCITDAATHVPCTGLDVSFRVNQFGAGAPGLRMQYLLTRRLLKDKKRLLRFSVVNAI